MFSGQREKKKYFFPFRWWRKGFICFLVGNAIIFLILFLWLTPEGLPLFGDPTAYFLRKQGRPAFTSVSPVPGETDYLVEYIDLTSTSGLEVSFAVKRPTGRVRRLPVFVLIGGHRTGRKAVHLIRDAGATVIVALDYPFEENPRMKGFEAFKSLPQIRMALYDVPPAAMLVMDYLSTQPYVDPDRIELVGISLGAPLACIAGALDDRFSRVWAIEGGGDLYRLFQHNLSSKLPSKLTRTPAACIATLLVHSLAPEKWVHRIAPRPFIMVNAEMDERIPAPCSELLFSQAKEPKEMILISDTHVHPKRQEAVQNLVRLVLKRMKQT